MIMEKEYLNCKIGLTPQCPHFDDPLMRKLLVPPIINNSIPKFNINDLIAVNSLCNDCGSFIPKDK